MSSDRLRERAAELRAHPMYLFCGGMSWPMPKELDEREAVLLDLLADCRDALYSVGALPVTPKGEKVWDDCRALLARIDAL